MINIVKSHDNKNYIDQWYFIQKETYQMNQCTAKLTIRLVGPAKTQIRLRIRTVWSEPSLIACAFYILRTIHRGNSNEYTQHTIVFIEDRKDIHILFPFVY